MIVKVCGMRDADNIRDVDALNPDLMGFIFYAKSPRAVREKPSYMPEHAERVGVFVNHGNDFVLARKDEYGLAWAQLHGIEKPAECRELKENGLKVIKAFSIATAEDFGRVMEYEDSCDLFIFDTKSPGVGGSGKSFDWTLLDNYHGRLPFLLSGGIGPDTDISCVKHEKLAGIDLNSRFETEPGLKNVEALKEYIRKYR